MSQARWLSVSSLEYKACPNSHTDSLPFGGCVLIVFKTTVIVELTPITMPDHLPVIDLDVFVTGSHNSDAVVQECKKVCFFRNQMIIIANNHL